MDPPMKMYKGAGAKKEGGATGHPILELRLEENVKDVVSQPRFPADTVQDVWLNVFSKLEPEDKPVFFRTLPEWHDDWMASKRTQLLIPEVAPILLETLSKQSLLQSRLLCKTWTNELDTHFENPGLNLHLPFEIAYKLYKHQSYPIPKHVYNFTSTERIQEFLQVMRTHSGNPFLWGNIVLQWISGGEPPQRNPESLRLCTEYWNNAILLLNQFGRHVLSASIGFTDSSLLNGWELARIFQNIILEMPNLKGITMCGTSLRHSLLLQTYLRRNPLPLLQNLEMVNTSCTAGELISAVLNCCCDPSKIKRLKLHETNEIRESGIPELVYTFRNLEVMSTYLYMPNLQRLGSIDGVPPLREINLMFLDWPSTLEELFAALQPFRDTLVSVITGQVRVQGNEEGVGTRIDLPNLRRLSFRFYEGELDPLLQLAGSLTHLAIHDARRNKTETVALNLESEVLCLPSTSQPTKDLVDFYGFEKDMYSSNIWELFPYLTYFRYGSLIRNRSFIHFTCEFSRNKYDEIKAGNSKSDGKLVAICHSTEIL